MLKDLMTSISKSTFYSSYVHYSIKITLSTDDYEGCYKLYGSAKNCRNDLCMLEAICNFGVDDPKNTLKDSIQLDTVADSVLHTVICERLLGNKF